MRKIVCSEYLSLDGVMEEPAWTVPFWNDEIAKYKYDENFASDALLLGRVTYQGFAAAWPKQTDESEFPQRMNGLPKFVVTTTLKTLEWNNSRLIGENIPAEISALKQQPGQDILLYGSAGLVNTLMQHDLIDEYHLLVYPVVLGKGKRLFQTETQASLKLVDTRSFSSGVVALTYQPDRK